MGFNSRNIRGEGKSCENISIAEQHSQDHQRGKGFSCISKLVKGDELLVGLGKEFEIIWSSILMMQSLSSFNNMCTMIQREETRRKVMQEYCNKKGNQNNNTQVVFLTNKDGE